MGNKSLKSLFAVPIIALSTILLVEASIYHKVNHSPKSPAVIQKVETDKLLDVRAYLSAAESALLSDIKNGKYPNPEKAKGFLDKAINEIGDRGDLDDKLRAAYDSLPEQNKMQAKKDIDYYNQYENQLSTVNSVKTELNNLIYNSAS